MKISRSFFTLLSMLVILSFLLASCAAPAVPTAVPAKTEPTKAPAQPAATTAPSSPPVKAEEKVLQLLYYTPPVILNGHMSIGNKDSDASRIILEPLANWDPSGEVPIPVLAAEIPTVKNGGMSQDLKTTTWKLKQGVKWSDGTDFTADDVVFTWQFITNPVVGSSSFGAYAGIEKVEAVDKNTAKITWKKPNSEPFIAFVGLYGMILQKKQFEPFNNDQGAKAPANLNPIGTGPYKLVQFKSGDVIIYEKNPLYREASKVYFDRVMLKSGGDAASAARAVVQTGEYHLAPELSMEKDVLENMMKSATTGKFDIVQSTAVERITFNFTNPDANLPIEKRSQVGNPHPFLSDKRVREALTIALNRGDLVKQLYGDSAVATCNVLAGPPSMYSKKHDVGTCQPDLARAKKLLDDAGWKDTNGKRVKDGVEMKILIVGPVNTLREKIKQYVKAAWEPLGIAVELKSVQSSIFSSVDPGNPDTAGKFYADISQINAGGAGGPLVSRYMQNWLCSEVARKENNFATRNRERYCNEQFDALYNAYLSEPDTAKAAQIAIQMNDILVEDFATVPIARNTRIAAVSNKLKGFINNPLDCVTWNIADWRLE